MKFFLFLLFIIPLLSRAQFHANFGAGYGNHNPAFQLSAGYQVNKAVMEGTIISSLGRHVNSDHYFGAKAGYEVGNFVPSVGYYFNYRNADDKQQNHAAAGFSLKYLLHVNDNGGFYAEALYIEKNIFITAGFHIIID